MPRAGIAMHAGMGPGAVPADGARRRRGRLRFGPGSRAVALGLVALAAGAAALAWARERDPWVALSLLASVAAGGGALWWRQRSVRIYRGRYQAELERLALLRRRDLVANYGSDVVCLADERLAIVEVNDRAAGAWGYSREELLGMNLRDIADPATPLEAPGPAGERAPAEGAVFESRHRRRDGSTFPVEAITRAVELDGKHYYQCIFRDIAERRRAEEALRASEEKFRAVFLEAPIGIVLVGLGGAVLAHNRSFQALTGYDDDELRRMTMYEISHPDDREVAREAFGRMRAGQVARLQLHKRYLRRSGEVMEARVHGASIRDAAGRHQFAAVMFEDVTEQRRAEAAVRQSEERLKLALDVTDDGVWDWDVPSDAVYLSPRFCRMLDYQPSEIATGAQLREAVHPDDRTAHAAALQDHLEGRTPSLQVEIRVRTGRGEWKWVENRAKVVQRDAQGRPVRVVGAYTDIEDRKAMQARLLLADRMASMGTLAAGAAHEINNPLAYALANLGFARESLDELRRAWARGQGERGAGEPAQLLAESQRALDEAREGVERVRQIVRDLGTFSRPDDEAQGPVDVIRVLQSSLNLAQNEIRHRARLHTRFAPVPTVTASEPRLGQVFLNLAVNAAQAIPEGRADENEIAVSTRADGDRVVVEFRDSGAGIAPDVLGRIFDPFFTTKRIGEGTGLGLSICHGIVVRLGGNIEVESEPGRGSVFRVQLPATKSSESQPAAVAPDARPVGRRGRILLVDDDPRLGRAVERLLAPEHEVVALTSAREALERVRAGEGYDLVLCDLMMPEMTGMDLHAELARCAPALAAQMVFMTGGAFTPRAREFLQQVDNRQLEKPFSPDVLRQLLAEVLA